ncbi:MAG: dethiobiotin synthase [Deltaproteobacteria bacterium]|nr:dethiobiotin synthase [Deltaproteobacteria bacterium]MDQ3295024.1 dethiobiotin synthase [Myxococcota bacterium]
MKGLFITGTGTGVGKTFVTAHLARQAVRFGKRVFAFKPVETGCARIGDELYGADQELLFEAAGGWQQGRLRRLYCFELAIAPLPAARAVGVDLDLAQIAAVFREGAEGVDLALVEGAGGWRVPLTLTADMASLAKQLGLPVVVVGTAGLGTINHTLLTVEAVSRDGCVLAGVVLSCRPDEDLAFARANAVEIERRTGARVVVLHEPEQLVDV